MIGKVKWFNNEKGYGFIDYENNDVIVHYSSILNKGYRSLIAEELVNFDLVKTNKGLRAKNVVTIGDSND